MLASPTPFGIILFYRGGKDEAVDCLWEIIDGMAYGYVNAVAAQGLDDRRGVHVAACDVMAPLREDEGQAAHAATAYANEVIGSDSRSVLTRSVVGGGFAWPEIL